MCIHYDCPRPVLNPSSQKVTTCTKTFFQLIQNKHNRLNICVTFTYITSLKVQNLAQQVHVRLGFEHNRQSINASVEWPTTDNNEPGSCVFNNITKIFVYTTKVWIHPIPGDEALKTCPCTISIVSRHNCRRIVELWNHFFESLWLWSINRTSPAFWTSE